MKLCDVVVETERLVLRAVSPEDTADIFRNFTERVTRYMYPSSPACISETADFINASLKMMDDGTDLVAVIREKEDDAFVGCCGLHKIGSDAPEFGIWIREESFGRGLGREAVHGLYRWACKHVRAERYLYPVDRDNIPSRKIPVSLGGEESCAKTVVTPDGRTLNLVEYFIPSAPQTDKEGNGGIA